MNPETITTESCVEVCNSLLRGEISAIETYSQTIHKFPNEFYTPTLEGIRAEHIAASHQLRENIQLMGGIPDTTSGTWGSIAKTVHTISSFFGENATLSTLIQGEDHGRSNYENALHNNQVMPECKVLIEQSLLPATEHHLATLKAIHPNKE